MNRRILLALAALLVCAGLAFGGWKWYDSHVDRSGWAEENGVRRYRDFHGKAVTGWQEIDGKRYCFGADGAMLTGWQEVDGSRFYLDETGVMATGWLDIGADRYYLDADGVPASGWREIDGNHFYFESDGTPARGWLETPDGRYYLDQEGAAATGWQEVDGSRYHFGEDGALTTGWLDLDGGRCYLDETGVMATGWHQIDGKRYFFSEDGAAVTGWMEEGEYRYYFLEDGSAAVGPNEIDGQTYYFSPSGVHLWLVNPWNYLHEDYEAELVVAEAGYRVAEICKDPLLQMLADCRAAGYNPVICAGYRSYWDQRALYLEKIAEYGQTVGQQIVAVPNTSEHQLGLAVDIVTDDNRKLNASQAKSAMQQWLMEHCWEYGFILRYPTGTTDITGIIFEPWHYRYVGVEVALELRDLGITLEEYLGADLEHAPEDRAVLSDPSKNN